MTTLTQAPPPRKSSLLLDRYRELRASGASAMVRREAYNDWFRQCCKEGRNPSALRIHSPEEVERFWAQTVPGPDGHVYWTGPKTFLTNDGSRKKPQRWAWQASGRALELWTEIDNVCGEPHCVNPEHMRERPRGERRVRLPDERAFGAVQALALRLGHTPSPSEWNDAALRVTAGALERRFGSWGGFCRRAGLDWKHPTATDADTCIEAIQALAAKLGEAPNRRTWEANGGWLRERGYPTSATTIRQKLNGSFAAIVAQVLKDAR